jgi:DNA-binding SARP family transcriptional activator
MELLVYLIVHRDGAPLTEILSALWPDVTTQKANQRLSTCLGNLRRTIRGVLAATDPADRHETTDGPRPEPIVNTGGHYHLDPAIVTVDWWQLLDEQHTGAPPATDALVIAARSRIADGYHYPWLDTDQDRAIR